MPEREVCSPVSTRYRGSKVGSLQPLSPGARSDPGRVDRGRPDSIPEQASRGRDEQPEPAPRATEQDAAPMRFQGNDTRSRARCRIGTNAWRQRRG
jgi:hypothetical protein